MDLLNTLVEKGLRRESPTREEALAVLATSDDELLDVVAAAGKVRRQWFGRRVKLNYLVNLKSGLCPEDCSYCSQRLGSKADILKYTWLKPDEASQAAAAGLAGGAKRVCLVASGRGPTDRDVDRVSDTIKAIKEQNEDVEVCACLGLLSDGQAERLREAGAHLDVLVLVLDRLDRVGDPVHVTVRGAAAAGHQADPLGAPGEPGRRGPGGLLGLEPGVLEDLRLGTEPLRTVRAVLRAETALQVHQVVELDPPAEPLAADLAGRGHHVEHVVVGGGQYGQRLVAGRQLAPKPLVHQRVQQVHEVRSWTMRPLPAKESLHNRDGSTCGYCHIMGTRSDR